MRVRSLLSVAALTGSLTLVCQPAQAAVSEVPRGAVVATDIVEYRCTTSGVTEEQDIKVKIELTMPADAVTGEQMTIGWRGTYVDDATALRAPATELAGGTKLYAYASISELAGMTSATGVGELTALGAGQIIALPTTTVPLKTTSANAGTARVRPAAVNFGTGPTGPAIECEVKNADALTTYPLTVTSADDQPAGSLPVTPSTQPTPTVTTTSDDQPIDSVPVPSDPQPTQTVTATVTGDPEADGIGTVVETPAGGVATGGGGESGPDGRMLMVTGFLLTLAAATGLLLRRRGLRFSGG
ncbi:hypothetical protein [Streptosporangium lutulentum]|uniref:Uncharacterized protein n=1 Tax=Streptosporangium lutulentum TaxID=1461250 RepID=A0ABT9QK53_9ACTN|nr:hypothetical protein [Streptosporangium lutulentum]MDP9847137.1 hypothetical protein [Streptosporangium lutulentum]